MIDLRLIVNKVWLSVAFIFVIVLGGSQVQAQDGKALFQTNCASCHAVHKDLTGPKLAGLEERGPWGDRTQLYAWIANPAKFMSVNKYAADLKNQWGSLMTAFPQLSNAEVDAIVDYINSVPDPATAAGATVGTSVDKGAESDNAILYGVLTLILAVIGLVLLQVNSNLRKLADDKEGIPSSEPIPFYRNKSYITLLTLVFFVIGGFFVVKGAIGAGRHQNFQPEQPIYYSHAVHAGTNQINCLYCHGGAMEGKHANIPSVNVCMNCHLTINEYSGADLFKADGTKVDGTAEIQKLYEYAGFTPGEPWDATKAKPIEWVKIHNLPDHVYFNHAQHAKAGKVQCQTCHGEIQKMGEVYQFSDLSMGWCINCHRETKVDFVDAEGNNGNKFYSIYQKYHDEIKNKTRDSITVNDIGGLECQKCHY